MKRALARRLSQVEGFRNPDVELEQYTTSPALAANLVHLADLQGDLDRDVLDLGTGTGMLTIAVACRSPPRVVGVDIDHTALTIARANEASVEPPTGIEWLQADATDPPIRLRDATVVMNPPFGARHGSRGADREFLDAARAHARVSYSVHNSGSRAFIESYADDHGGTVTHAFAAELPVDAQFEFHTSDRATLDVEVFRVEWSAHS